MDAQRLSLLSWRIKQWQTLTRYGEALYITRNVVRSILELKCYWEQTNKHTRTPTRNLLLVAVQSPKEDGLRVKCISLSSEKKGFRSSDFSPHKRVLRSAVVCLKNLKKKKAIREVLMENPHAGHCSLVVRREKIEKSLDPYPHSSHFPIDRGCGGKTESINVSSRLFILVSRKQHWPYYWGREMDFFWQEQRHNII